MMIFYYNRVHKVPVPIDYKRLPLDDCAETDVGTWLTTAPTLATDGTKRGAGWIIFVWIGAATNGAP